MEGFCRPSQILYGFYTAVAGDTHIWVLQFVIPIGKALYSRSTTQIEVLSIFVTGFEKRRLPRTQQQDTLFTIKR